MTRPWGRVYGAMLTHRKYLRSSHEERSAWLTLFLSTLNSPADDDLGTRQDVETTLRTLGQHRHPAAILSRLVEVGWVDELEGHFFLHDWRDCQPVDPTGAARKAAKRRGTWDGQAEDLPHVVRGMSAERPRTGRGHSDAISPTLEERREEEKRISTPSARTQDARVRPAGWTDVVAWLAKRRVYVPETSANGHVEHLSRLLEQHGWDAVLAQFEVIAPDSHELRQFVLGADNVLNAVPRATPRNGKHPARSLSDLDFDADMVGLEEREL